MVIVPFVIAHLTVIGKRAALSRVLVAVGYHSNATETERVVGVLWQREVSRFLVGFEVLKAVSTKMLSSGL
jgi:hypothetical protein